MCFALPPPHTQGCLIANYKFKLRYTLNLKFYLIHFVFTFVAAMNRYKGTSHLLHICFRWYSNCKFSCFKNFVQKLPTLSFGSHCPNHNLSREKCDNSLHVSNSASATGIDGFFNTAFGLSCDIIKGN